MMSLSVISSFSAPRGRPVSRTSSATSSTRFSRSISPVDRLTLTVRSPAAGWARAPVGQLVGRRAHHVRAQLHHQAHLVA